MTLSEISAVSGENREAIRRTVAVALGKCRIWCDRHGLTLADLLPDPPPEPSDEFALRIDEFERALVADINAARDQRNEERRRSAKIGAVRR
jgi:hypothetical protein